MVNTGAFDSLSPIEHEEFKSHCESFKQSVLESGVTDAFDFEQKYYLQRVDGQWAMTQPGSKQPFADITVSSPGVMEALLNEALESLSA